MSRLKILRRNFAARRLESEEGGGGGAAGYNTLRRKVTVWTADLNLSKLIVLFSFFVATHFFPFTILTN